MSIAELLQARYGTSQHPLSALGAKELGALKNQTFESLLMHRSVRAFDDRPVPEHTL